MPSTETYLTRSQSRDIDRIAIDDYGIPGIVLMENAGRNAAEIIRARWCADADATVAIVCGRGNNGGDGFVIARHLTNRGIQTSILLTATADSLEGDALTNYKIARRMQIPKFRFATRDEIASNRNHLSRATVVVDAILGTGFHGNVRPPLDEAIRAINENEATVVAIDVPSGLDCDTGRPSNATVRATMTITFVAKKAGFRDATARDYCGEIQIADIGAPRQIVNAII
jgi:NAD(P)H-hydrate epimerase